MIPVLKKGIKWTSINSLLQAIFALLKLAVLARFLGKTDFGLMAIVAFVLGFFTFFNGMGLKTAILHKQDVSQREYDSLYWLNFLVGLLMFGFVWILAPFITLFYGYPELRDLIVVGALGLIISGFGRLYQAREQKQLRFKVISIINILSSVFALVVAIYFAIIGHGVWALVYSMLAQSVLSNFFFLVIGLKKYGLRFYFSFNDTLPFLKIGLYQILGQSINYFTRDIDVLIIGKFFSAEVLGGYSLAKNLVLRLFGLTQSIIQGVFAPYLASFQHDIKRLKEEYLRLVSINSSINILAFIPFFILAPYIVTLLYGAAYANIVPIARLLSIYLVLRSINTPVGSLLMATGRTDYDFYWNLLVFLVLPVFILASASFGIQAICTALIIMRLLAIGPSWYFFSRRLVGVSFKELFMTSFRVDIPVLLSLIRTNK